MLGSTLNPSEQTSAIDLAWVEFSEEEAQPCMALVPCDKEAVWRSTYNTTCDCFPSTWYWCEMDGQLIQKYEFLDGECKLCSADMTLISHVRWKKGST